MDGIIRGRMRRPGGSSPKNSNGLKFGPNSVKGAQPQMGDFNRKEGFVPRKAKSLTPDGRSLGRQSNRPIKPIDMKMKDAPKKKRLGKKRNWKKIVMRTFAGLVMLVLIVSGYLAFKGILRTRQVFKGGGEALAWDCDPDPNKLKGEGDGRINFLLLGKGGPEQKDGPDLTDTIILASIDPCNKEAGLLSIPRDLAVKMDSGETTKINAVYALTKISAIDTGKSEEEAEKAGIESIQKSVENVTGVPIRRYVMLDFTAFEQAINAVGGISVDVKEPVYEHMSLKGKPYTLNVKEGQEEFDGLRALAYTRSRYTSARGDFARSERQREVIVALKDKVLSLGTYSNPVKVSQLIDSFGGRVRTNMSIPDDVSKLYNLSQEIDSSKIASVSLVDEPNVLIESSSHPSLGSIQIPTAGIYRYDEINNFVRNTFKDGFLKKEDAKVVVLNGTTVPGLATTKADILKSYGYNVVKIDDAPDKNTPNTVLVDLRSGSKKYTKRYLELRYKTTATGKLPEGVTPPEEADFVIILGQNETSNR